MFHQHCPSSLSTWLQTRKAIFLPLLLSPSASTKGTLLESHSLRWITSQFVTYLSQPSSKVSFATHLTLQSWSGIQQSQANLMAFSSCWTPNLMNWPKRTGIPRDQKLVAKNSRCSSIHLLNTPASDLDLMQWTAWRRWLERKASSNFQTGRRNAWFTTGKNARLRNTWGKFRRSANAFLGLYKMIRFEYDRNIGSLFVSSVRSSNSHPDLLVIHHPTHFFRSHRSSTLDFHFLSH